MVWDCISRVIGVGKGEVNDGNFMVRWGVGEGINENWRGCGKVSYEGENGEFYCELFWRLDGVMVGDDEVKVILRRIEIVFLYFEFLSVFFYKLLLLFLLLLRLF